MFLHILSLERHTAQRQVLFTALKKSSARSLGSLDILLTVLGKPPITYMSLLVNSYYI